MSKAEVRERRAPPEIRWRRLGLFAAAAASAAFVFAALSRSFWAGGGEAMRFGVGLRGVLLCREEGCSDQGLAALGGAASSWEQIGIAAFAAAVVAAFFLAASAILTFRRRGARFPARLGAATSLFAAAVGTAFILFAPELEGLRPGAGMIAFYLGAALGTGSGVLLAPADHGIQDARARDHA